LEPEEEQEFLIKDSFGSKKEKIHTPEPEKILDVKVVGKVDLDEISGKKKKESSC